MLLSAGGQSKTGRCPVRTEASRRTLALAMGAGYTRKLLQANAGGTMTKVTRIISAIEQGDPHAAEKLLPLVYDELRKLAAKKLAHEKPGQTLDATALVHEAYLRLVVPPRGECQPPVDKHWNSS